MKFDYNELLCQQLYSLQASQGLSDFKFEVDSEQAFLKKKDLDPKTIYVLTKDLQSDKSIGVDTQPVQLLVLTEQNSLDVAKAFFSKFAETYNFKAHFQSVDGQTAWIKQQYSDPVVLSNFNTIAAGYRSVMYISATLYIMYDVVDLHDLTIDGVEVQALSFDLAYNMTPNTQQLSKAGEYIAISVKSASSLIVTLTIPVIDSDLTGKILDIVDEKDNEPSDGDDITTYGGNENFLFDFYLGSHHFEDKKLKLTAVEFGSAINNVPAFRLGFMK